MPNALLIGAKGITTFQESGYQKLAWLRADGNDPAITEEANAKRSATHKRHYEQKRQYEALHPMTADTRERWQAEYLPRIQGVPIRALARASGLSLKYCSLIRRGLFTPHPMYWDSLLSIAPPL
jgi:hypothetical protein